MKRISTLRPGYDCIRNPCGKNGCGVHPGSSHGIHGDEWVYVVTDGECALSLVVYSHHFPPSVPTEHLRQWAEKPTGADISMHAAFATDPDAIKEAREGNECEWLTVGRCFIVYSGSLAASEFYTAHGVPAFEQPESFWSALEDRFVMLEADAQSERADRKCARCPTCSGTGLVSL